MTLLKLSRLQGAKLIIFHCAIPRGLIRDTTHIAPRGAKKEEAFGGVILKSERPSGALFTNSGPPFFTVESKIEVLSPLGTSSH